MPRQVNPIMAALRTERLRRGMTLTELSHLVGYNRKMLSACETGYRTPNLFQLIAWAQVFNFTLTLTGQHDPS